MSMFNIFLLIQCMGHYGYHYIAGHPWTEVLVNDNFLFYFNLHDCILCSVSLHTFSFISSLTHYHISTSLHRDKESVHLSQPPELPTVREDEETAEVNASVNPRTVIEKDEQGRTALHTLVWETLHNNSLVILETAQLNLSDYFVVFKSLID